jgi:hypothetical protein
MVYVQTKSAMELINKDTHHDVDALKHIGCSEEQSQINLIIEQGLEEISTQVSLLIHIFFDFVLKSILKNDGKYTGNAGPPNSVSSSDQHQKKYSVMSSYNS